MAEFLIQFASRLAVMVPVILLVAWLAWITLTRLGYATPGAPFNAADMRTWPLRFALVDAAIFATVFAAVSAALAGNELSAGVAGGVSALVAIGLVPWLAARMGHRQ